MKRPLFLLIAVLTIVPMIAVAFLSLSRGMQQRTLPIFGQVPSFRLTERSGHPVERDDLRGNIWIANFIFTQCQGQCPLISMQMRRLQESLAANPRVRFVSFTVDPDHDSPQVLGAYAQRYAADPQRWLFLTGKKQDLALLIHHGFRLASGMDGAAPEMSGGEAILHSFKFVLVDANQQIRGYYDATNAEAVDLLRKDVKRLLKQAR